MLCWCLWVGIVMSFVYVVRLRRYEWVYEEMICSSLLLECEVIIFLIKVKGVVL